MKRQRWKHQYTRVSCLFTIRYCR